MSRTTIMNRKGGRKSPKLLQGQDLESPRNESEEGPRQELHVKETNANDGKDNNEDLADQKETVNESNTNISFNLVSVVGVVVLLIGIVYACTIDWNKTNETAQIKSINYSVDVYDRGLQDLQTILTSQTSRFWRTLKHRGLAHLRNKSPTQPLVFLLAAPPHAHDVVDCFATKLGGLLDPENKHNLVKISGQQYSNNQGDDTKEAMDRILCDTFEKGNKAALVHHLQLLPPPSPILFYSYCDDQNAPYKHAALIFTVHLPKVPDSSLSPVEAEGTVEKYLAEDVWANSPYDRDAIGALLSRIADTVVLVSPEEKSTVDSLCQGE